MTPTPSSRIRGAVGAAVLAAGILLADHHYAVTYLKYQIGIGKQVHTRTVDTGYIYTVHAAEVEASQLLAIDFGLGDEDTAGNHRSVLLFPVYVYFFSDKGSHRFGIFFGTYDEELVSYVEYCFMIGDTDVPLVAYARTYKRASQKILYLEQGLSGN